MIYFTSDLHLGHRGIISMQQRPFESVEAMNKTILMNFNAVVNKDDTVYILGDICHHMNVDAANEIIADMNGKKYLITGKHDKNMILHYLLRLKISRRFLLMEGTLL